MACSSRCGHRRDDDDDNSEYEQPAKPQQVPKRSQKLSLPKAQPKIPRTSHQPPPTAVHPHPPSAQPLFSSNPLDTTTNSKSVPTPAQTASLPSDIVVRRGFFTRFRKWLKLLKVSPKLRQGMTSTPENQISSTGAYAAESNSSNRRVSSALKAHASRQATKRIPEPIVPSSSLVPTSVPHAADHVETPSSQVIMQLIVTSSMDKVAHDHSKGVCRDSVPSASRFEIPKDKLKRIEAYQFQFSLTPIPGDYAKVNMPAGFPERVTTLSARSKLITTFPPYAANHHYPNRVQKKKMVYYEVKDVPDDWGTDGNIRFGFSRLDAKGPPGSSLGSVGVDRNDGGLYYNGVRIGSRQNFQFDSGVKIGIGILLSYVNPNSDSDMDSTIKVRVIHTRQGDVVDNICGDTIGVDGRDFFDGKYDLFATVGTVDRVVFDVLFEEKDWSFNLKEWLLKID